jgi:RNA polymerase sigma-70 factor (ECF subfamily)
MIGRSLHRFTHPDSSEMSIHIIVKVLQPKFIALAYRTTGEVAVSKDMVQDVISQWVVNPLSEVKNIEAYLSRSVTNRCLNYLSLVKRRRELYRGMWLPEPIISAEISLFETTTDLSYGFMVLLGKLTPSERAVFLLRESFDMGYQELAELLSLTQTNCRQLYHRAKERMRDSKRRFPTSWHKHGELLHAFTIASRTGQLDAFIGLLKNDISFLSDGGGLIASANKPVFGIDRVGRFLKGLVNKWLLTQKFMPVHINGDLGLLLFNEQMQQFETAMILAIDQDQVSDIYVIINPVKIGHLIASFNE